MSAGTDRGCACRVCGGGVRERFRVREMMFGSGEEFDYFRCADCGCVQIREVPEDPAAYYPAGYFAFRARPGLARRPVRAAFDRMRVASHLWGGGTAARWIDRFAKPLDYIPWLRLAGVGPGASILDVGCGTGKLLLRLGLGGFDRCLGLDPFLPESIRYPNGLRVLKRDLIDYARTARRRFDLVMFHHSYEHLPDPRATLAAAARLLRPHGCVLVRVPLADSEAFETYREHWVQWDAPRHLYLHTRASLAAAAAHAGLTVERVTCDSTRLQFVGSELYRRGIALQTAGAVRALFGPRELRAFDRRARELNRLGRGDQGVFYLRRT